VDAGVAAKARPAPVGVPEALLRERLRDLTVTDRRQHEPEDPRPVALHDPVEVGDLGRPVLDAGGYETGGGGRLHAPI
jgi:hypothetical protein